jgi:hypothetical protein
MDRKKTLLLVCVIVLLAVCLGGCGKNKVIDSSDYQSDEVTALQIKADTWKLSIVTSSDENIHISLNGSVSNNEHKPIVALENGTLTVVQESSDEKLQDQIALGKKGQITLYLPSSCTIPIAINNGMGDIEADNISVTNFELMNNSGYVTLTHLAADDFKIKSTSGDITVKNSDISGMTTIATSSGYVQLSSTMFNNTEIVTKSGEVNMSEISPNTSINVQTGSGDINLDYQTTPDNLDFGISSGSKDITARFKEATYSKKSTSCKQGIIGDGQNKLEINSDNGTVVVK